MDDDNLTRHAVSFGNPGDTDYNTIVLGGIDLVVPLAMDIDRDPLHDDEVRLRASNGFIERTLQVGGADVECDLERSIASYRFRAVPPGVYDIATRIAGAWIDVVRGLVVKRAGVYLHDEKVDGERTSQRPAASGHHAGNADVPEEDVQDPDAPLYLDQTPDLDDPELV
jgi:hypothetical protein